MGVSISKEEVWHEMEGPKIKILLDNRSLNEVLRILTTRKRKDLRWLGRWINWTKTSMMQDIVMITRVSGGEQKANPIYGAGDCSWATGLHGESYIAYMIRTPMFTQHLLLLTLIRKKGC